MGTRSNTGLQRGASSASIGTVLIVDDELPLLKALERQLRGVARVVPCTNGADAVWYIREVGGVEVVVSDISMPGMTGLELLRALRTHDQDLPVVLMTGLPTVETATQAIERGVFRYLLKPFEAAELRKTVAQASQLYRLARIKRAALSLAGVVGASDRVGLEVNFQRALESLYLVFQPIVSLSGQSVYGYEALARTTERSLPGPSELLAAAEQLGTLPELGRLVRRWAAELFQGAPPETKLFLNVRPEDLADTDLLDPNSALAAVADRTVLEVTERASLHGIEDVGARVGALRARGFQIAVGDLGSGYAGLSSFALLEPDTVKLDVTLARSINADPVRQRLVASMTSLCAEMAIDAVVEGIETIEERDTLRGLGCDLFQGHLFAQPGPPFPAPLW